MSKLAVRAYNARKKDDDKTQAATRLHRIRVACPYCQDTVRGDKALNTGAELDGYATDDFHCPTCGEALILESPLFGFPYFRKAKRREAWQSLIR